MSPSPAMVLISLSDNVLYNYRMCFLLYIIFDELFLAVPVLTCSLSLYLLFYCKPDKERIKLH